jgi:hypothetical protein
MMVTNAPKIEQSEKIKLLVSSLALAIFMVFVGNVFYLAIVYFPKYSEPSFQINNFSFENTYLTINNEKVGFALFFNLLGLFFLWLMMTYHNLKSIKKPFVSIFL